MSLKDLNLNKLSKLTSDYTDELKCLECCKYFIAPATAACGHTLCHTCWRVRRTCPICATALDRKSLKLNLPLQALTTHVQTLGEAFEKLFKIELDEFTLDTTDFESEKDPVKNVKEWLTSSQNHFSAPIPSSETVSQDSQQPCNAIEISASKIIVHTDVKKAISPSKVSKVMCVSHQQPQDDWDKIEPMPDIEEIPKTNEIIVGPMDIEPFFVDDNEYTTDHPRRSSRKRDVKCNNYNKKTQDLSANQNNSRESSLENDKKSQKGKQPWHNVKRMKKEFSKLNKKNRNKLNVSIEMVKKTQNVKAVHNTPPIATQQIVNIDDNTPGNTHKENEMIIVTTNDPPDKNDNTNPNRNVKEISNDLTRNSIVSKHINTENNNVTKNDSKTKNLVSKEPESFSVFQNNIKDDTKMKFIKKGALCPKNTEVAPNIRLETFTNVPEQETVPGNSDDIEISIKIGNTTTNIVIKKKNNIQVKINTDREVQTSLSPHNFDQKETPTKDKNHHNIDINVESGGSNNTDTHINKDKSFTTQTGHKGDKCTSEKKGTASADTATAQLEITESVEKELSNVMEYETADEQKNATQNGNTNVNNVPKEQHVKKPQNINENVETLDDLNDLDIFTGSVKEASVQPLKEHAPSEILISTVCSKLKTQRNAEKRNREVTEEDVLPTNKKVKMTSQQECHDKSVLPDSEPINYDVIMGQVFASIDADMEDIRKSQDTQNIKTSAMDPTKESDLRNKDLSQAEQTQIIKHIDQCNSDVPAINLQPHFNEKHSENVFSIIEKEGDNTKNDKIPELVEELLTPVICRNLDSSQESHEDLHRTSKSNKKLQDFDDSDRSVVEETPQKDLSFPKAKRPSTPNISQVTLSETKKIPSKVSTQTIKSVINLTDSVTETNISSRDVTIIEPAQKKLTLETPLTITKFADHIIHKSTPVARKSLNFDNENDDNDPEQTLCPTSEVIAKTTQEKEFMSKAFENTPMTPTTRPLMARNIVSKANRKYCLAASRLTSDEIVKVKVLCAERKWIYTEKYSKDVTHLVVSVDEENKSQRSVKYMCALADSKWIVSFEWILRCLKMKDIVDEEHFEALDSFGEPGPRRSRVAKQKIFQGIKFYCMPPFSVLDVATLKNMLTAAGGRVVKEIKDVRVTKDSPQPALLLAEPEHTQEDRFIYLAMEQSIVPVNFEWVLNCLGSYSLGSIQELLLCPSSLLPTATVRWPEVLLAQDYD